MHDTCIVCPVVLVPDGEYTAVVSVPLSETIDQLVEEVIFTDVRTEPIRQEWDRIKAEENVEFEKILKRSTSTN